MGCPSTYSDIVETYALAVLRHGADLQITPNGSIAMTRDGGIKLGDDQFNAFFRLVRGWELNMPTLQMLFASQAVAPELSRAIQEKQNSTAILVATGELPPEHMHSLSNAIAANGLACDTYAGTILVVLTNLLKRFRDDLFIPKNDQRWRTTPPFLGNCSFAQIAEAGANSFRHHDEWSAEWAQSKNFTPQQMKSIKVIVEVTGKTDLRLHARNVAADLLALLSGNSFEQMANNFFECAKSTPYT